MSKQVPSTSISIGGNSAGTRAVRLAFPLHPDASGRLATVTGEAAAVLQLMDLVRDLSGGEYPGASGLFNPCRGVELKSMDELVHRVCDNLERLMSGLGLEGVRASWQKTAAAGGELGLIDLRCDTCHEPWAVQLLIRRGSVGLALDAWLKS